MMDQSYKFVLDEMDNGMAWYIHYIEFFRDGRVRIVADSDWKRWLYEGKLTPQTALGISENRIWHGFTCPKGWVHNLPISMMKPDSRLRMANARLLLQMQQEAFRRMAEERKKCES